MSSGYQYIDLTDSIGILQIGSLFGVFLFGIVTLQTYNYYRTYDTDKWFNKALVTFIWWGFVIKLVQDVHIDSTNSRISELGHTLCICWAVYRVTITLYGKPEFLNRFQGIAASTVFGGLITLLAQGFYAMRILRLLPRPYNQIGTFCLLVSLARMGVSAYLTKIGTSARDLVEYKLRGKTLVTVVFVMGAAIDIIIAASLLYYLLVKRVQSGMERSTRLIDRLLTYTLRTGLITSITAVIVIICFRTMPDNLIWLAIYTFLAKLYSSSLLSALNARKELREDSESSVMHFPSVLGRTTSRFVSSQHPDRLPHNDIAVQLEERRSHSRPPRTSLYIIHDLKPDEPSVCSGSDKMIVHSDSVVR